MSTVVVGERVRIPAWVNDDVESTKHACARRGNDAQQLVDSIAECAAAQGYAVESAAHASEFGKIIVRDPQGGRTVAVIPNAHHGKRLKKHQVRYTVRDLNRHWED
jgi:hypothetical protein